MKHAKVTTTTATNEGTIIETESYYEQLSHAVREVERKRITSKQTVVADIIRILEHITKEGSPMVVIEVQAKVGVPHKIIERWVEYKESFNRK